MIIMLHMQKREVDPWYPGLCSGHKLLLDVLPGLAGGEGDVAPVVKGGLVISPSLRRFLACPLLPP